MSSTKPQAKPQAKKKVVKCQVVVLEQDGDEEVQCMIKTKCDKKPFLTVQKGILKVQIKGSDRPPTSVSKGQVFPMPLKFSLQTNGNIKVSYQGQTTIGNIFAKAGTLVNVF